MSLLLAGDIGGTSTRLGLFEIDAGRLRGVVLRHYRSRDYSGLDAILADFIADEGCPAPVSTAFGIAGPVGGGRVVTPNLPWVVEAGSLTQRLGGRPVFLLNDLEANAWGLGVLGPADFLSLQAGKAGVTGNIALISAGTGLGEAWAVPAGERLQPFPCEGGHADFAPRDDLETELLHYLRKRFGRVSCERVLSGPGLYNLYAFLLDSGRGIELPAIRARIDAGDPAATIGTAALAGDCGLCAAAVALFVSLYGAEAGNLALKVMANGGVYLGGGMAPKLLAPPHWPAFLEAFLDKGRMRPLLETMPVRVVMNDHAALLGAARRAALAAGLSDPNGYLGLDVAAGAA